MCSHMSVYLSVPEWKFVFYLLSSRHRYHHYRRRRRRHRHHDLLWVPKSIRRLFQVIHISRRSLIGLQYAIQYKAGSEDWIEMCCYAKISLGGLSSTCEGVWPNNDQIDFTCCGNRTQDAFCKVTRNSARLVLPSVKLNPNFLLKCNIGFDQFCDFGK